jgi:hypothetical protein
MRSTASEVPDASRWVPVDDPTAGQPITPLGSSERSAIVRKEGRADLVDLAEEAAK